MKALLMLIAGADFTAQEAFHDFDRKLTEAGVPHEMHIYEGGAPQLLSTGPSTSGGSLR